MPSSDAHPKSISPTRSNPVSAEGDNAHLALSAAYTALDCGDAKQARELAQSVLIAARSTEERHLQAEALACLAHCDHIGSRLRRSADTARRASQIFESLNDTAGEARALTTFAQVCMLLGRIDEAYEAALLAQRLSEAHGPGPQLVIAHNTLGVASCWAGNFERAHGNLESAVVIGANCTPVVSGYEPRLNQAWVEAARLVDERSRTGQLGSLERLAWMVREFGKLETDGADRMLAAGLAPAARTVSCVMASLLASWQGRAEVARAAMDVATRSLLGTVTWLDALVRWGTAELAWSCGDLEGAEEAFLEMKSLALTVEYERFACTAQQLLIQVLVERGLPDAALQEHRELGARERRLVTESLEGRLAVVDWRLNARRTERSLQEALVTSRKFERWSLEDPLTGLLNRRGAEQALGERLRSTSFGGRPLTVAMVDVDKFKRINDTFSHAIGDVVLKELGQLMVSQIRENDLASRWAGDEFVILFTDTNAEVACQACERIHVAIAAFDWNSIASGLSVSVSIGITEAGSGDTIAELLARSDERMYESKSMGLMP